MTGRPVEDRLDDRQAAEAEEARRFVLGLLRGLALSLIFWAVVGIAFAAALS